MSCDDCNNSFSTKWNLKVHERLHTGDKAFSCKYCHVQFTQISDVKNHEDLNFFIKVDTPAMRLVKSKTHFSENENTHSEKNSNQCSYCEKTFKQSGNLRAHERIHTGKRSYSCNLCNKTYSDPSVFSKHKKSHVDENICNIKVEFLEPKTDSNEPFKGAEGNHFITKMDPMKLGKSNPISEQNDSNKQSENSEVDQPVKHETSRRSSLRKPSKQMYAIMINQNYGNEKNDTKESNNIIVSNKDNQTEIQAGQQQEEILNSK